MDERRKAKRIELDAKLFVKRLDKDEAQELNIDVFDISTSGIGFDCNEALTIGAVYEADLTLWNKDVIHSFIEIVRISKMDSSYRYGGIFIGMPEMDLKRIEIYDTVTTYSNSLTVKLYKKSRNKSYFLYKTNIKRLYIQPLFSKIF